MGSHFQRFVQGLTCCLAALSIAATLALNPVLAADKAAAEALRSAFRDAARDAKAGDELDPAYELLGIAEAAQQQELPQIAAEAAAAFADLVRRAAAGALKAGGSLAEDTLDQFVDLRFMARSANLTLPQAALDDSMAKLFPMVTASLQAKFDRTESWEEKRAVAEEIADLQASATQVMNESLASAMGDAFECKAAALEALAEGAEDAAARAEMREAIAETRKLRDERVADAKANNINAVAALIQSQRERGEDGANGATDTQ